MRKIMIPLLLVMTLAFPVFVMAQDTVEPPTQEFVTIEPTQTADVVTSTPNPEATEEPLPPVEPGPLDEGAVPSWVFTVVVVLAVGIVSIAIVAIVQTAKSWPPAARELFLSFLNTGVGELDKVAVGTETAIDNAAVAELRKLVARLEAELRATQEQVSVNAENIASTNRVVSQSISSQ